MDAIDSTRANGQESTGNASNDLEISIPVPSDVVQQAREQRASFAREHPDAEPGSLNDYIVDQLSIDWNNE